MAPRTGFLRQGGNLPLTRLTKSMSNLEATTYRIRRLPYTVVSALVFVIIYR